MLQPKRQKYRKHFRGSMGGIATRGFNLDFGEYGLKSEGRGWLTAAQIEAARKAIVHHTKREGKLWIRIFPDKTFTRKPAGTRMGSGKGEVAGYVVVIKPGRILFELGGLTAEAALLALTRAASKLPFKTKLVRKE
jgi:large subunit ribosomal protein L16